MEEPPGRAAEPRSPGPRRHERPVTAFQQQQQQQQQMPGRLATNRRPSSDESSRVASGSDDEAEPAASSTTGAPLFWTQTRHGRSTSSVSYHSIDQARPTPIVLEDRSDEQDDHSQGCWARSVTIDDYTIISGATGIGAYVVWHITVSTLKGGDLHIRKRYSEFDRLRCDLVRSFPHADQMIPHLPRKSVVSRFRPKFLRQRKAGLGHFLNCILLNPEFAASPVLKDFIFS